MFKAVVASTQKIFSPADDKYVIEVELHIFPEDKPKKIEVRKLAFPLDTKEKKIKKELKKYVDEHNAEQKRFAENKEKDKVAKQSDKVVKSIEGLEL